jgi:cell wall-associated NlpC family hydrolase
MYRYIPYIGIPYVKGGRELQRDAGLDCWGLVVVIAKDLRSIELPKYDTINTHLNINQASSLLVNTDLYKDCDVVDSVLEGDLLLFKIVGNPLHIGYAISQSEMIHADPATGTVIENFRSKKWQSRLYRTYRLKTL